MKRTKWFILCLILGLVAQFGLTDSAKAAEDDVVVFEDENLADAIYSSIGKWENVTESDLLELESLDIYSEENITSLSGLEYAKNLKSIYITESDIADFTPISGLTQLESIGLAGSGLKELSSFSNLKNLKSLYLSNNKITDLSALKGLTNLTSLELSGNAIKDLSPLAHLTKLDYLSLADNDISDLSGVEGLTNVTWLILNGNNISDLSKVSKLSKLWRLLATDNNISDISGITELPSLGDVGLNNNPLNLSKGSATYENVQKLLKKNVNVVFNRENVFALKTKKITSGSITVEWSTLENTRQIADTLTLYLDGKKVTDITDSEVKEYTFSGLEKGKEYEIRVDFGFSLIDAGGLESVALKVKAEDAKTTDQVVAKPVVKGNTATISYENINAVKSNGQLVLDLKDNKDGQLNVQLTSEQVKILKENNISIEVAREDASVKIPASILGDGQDINFVMEKLEKAEGALSAVYDFTIETASGNISNFSVPVTLSFQVDESAVTNAENVKVWYYNPTTKEWELIGGTYENGVVTAETTHFSTYAVFEKDTPTDKESKPVASGDNAEKTTEQELGPKLPNTATDSMNFIILGALFIMLAIGMIVVYQNIKSRA